MCWCWAFLFAYTESVQAKPILTKSPANATVPIGDNVNFTCIVLSELHYHLEWYHGYHIAFDTVNTTNASTKVEVKVGMLFLNV